MIRFSSLSILALVLFCLALNPVAAQQPKGKKAPPKEPEPMDISDQVRGTIDPQTGKYYKISGPFGKSYFVTGDDFRFRSASITAEKNGNAMINVTRIVIDVNEDERGIQFIGMAGVQVELMKKDAKVPEVTVVRQGNQTVTFEEKGQVTIVIGKPVPPLPKPAPKAPPAKK